MSIEFRRILVLFCGIITTLITFGLFYALDGLDIMRSYQMLLIPLPAGAFALGLLSGSGYGLAGLPLTRLKFTVWMLWFIAISMVITYFVLVGIEYAREAPGELGFFAYFDQATRSSALVLSENAQETTVVKKLGPGGYFYRLYELVALSFGGLCGCVVGLFVPRLKRRRDPLTDCRASRGARRARRPL
jgi:hypothetical protein